MLQVHDIEFTDDRFALDRESGNIQITFGQDVIDKRNTISGFYQIENQFEAGDADMTVETHQGFIVSHQFFFQDRTCTGALLAVYDRFLQKLVDPVSVTVVTDDKAHYYPGASSFVTKLTADRESHKLLGIQVIGAGAVDKMTDIAVTGIAMGAKIEDFDTLEYSYAPPFSTAIHPFVQACCVLENKVSGELEGFEKEEKLLLVCTKGKRGYFLQNRLKAYGYTNTRVLEGGVFVNNVKVPHIEFVNKR